MERRVRTESSSRQYMAARSAVVSAIAYHKREYREFPFMHGVTFLKSLCKKRILLEAARKSCKTDFWAIN